MGSSTLKTVAIAAAAYFTAGAAGGVYAANAGAIAAGAAGTSAMMDAEKAKAEQEGLMQQSADEQKKIREIQVANAAQAQANERRQQIREERVRRSRLLASSFNTGGYGSSLEAGAVGGLSTSLGANIGSNLGAAQSGAAISDLSQKAADLNLGAQFAGFDAQNSQSMFQLSTSIFAANYKPKATTPAGG